MKFAITTTLTYCLLISNLFAQQTLTEKAETLNDQARSTIKQRAYEFLSTFNPSSQLIKPAEKELKSKILENKQKRKDPYKGTDKLQSKYDEAVEEDGTERSFLAQSFAQPMLHELKFKGLTLEAADIYTAQYVIKYVLGVPRFNYGELDVDNHNQMENELSTLISTYPDNDAHDQQVDGHIIDIFTEQANAYFETFVAANIANFDKDQGKSYIPNNLSTMNCGEKYEYLKKQGIMH